MLVRTRMTGRRGSSVLLAVISIGVAACGGSHAAPTRSTRTTPPTATQSAAPLEEQFVAVVREIQRQVVQIQTNSGLGSGIVFDRSGDIVTNAHVTAGSTEVAVTLADGRRFQGRVTGTYPPDDLAVVKIAAAQGVSPARFADSSKLAVGEIVLAEGNPLGLQSSVTDGIISALGRSVSEGQGVVIPDSIQTSAPINPGNSGGALVNLRGEVIGIPTLAAANPQVGSAAAGIGFAIPSNIVADIASQIIRYGRVVNSHRAALGASLADSSTGPGALVVALQQGGPAARAGVALGDLIERLDGKEISDASALASVLASHRPGDKVTATVRAFDGKTRTVTIALGELRGT